MTAVVLSGWGAVSAHDVPDAVTVQAFLRPEGQRLRLLMRVPLDAMRDVDIPKRGPGYVDLARVEPALRHAATIWLAQNTAFYEDDREIPAGVVTAVRASLPSDRSFDDYDRALAHVTGPPLDPATELYWEQGLLDAVIDYPIASAASRFSIRTDLRRLGQRVTYGLRLLTADGAVRAFQFHEDTGLVRLDPRWHQAALSFTGSGFRHVLDGADHLLFMLCLVIPLRRIRPLVLIVTAFTVAHSVTLLASAYGLAPEGLWFPPLVETLIALSIVYMALENVVGALAPAAGPAARGFFGAAGLEHRWMVAALFGLVHGFGFSFALREELQFAGAHLLTSLLAFNVGVELAQIVVIVAGALAVGLFYRRMVSERVGIVILSALVAHTGLHWLAERGAVLWLFPWTVPDAAMLARIVGWLMVATAAAAVWWASRLVRGRSGRAAIGPLGRVQLRPEADRGLGAGR